MLGQGAGLSYGAQNLQGLFQTPAVLPQIPTQQPIINQQPIMDVQYIKGGRQGAINYQMGPNKAAILLEEDDDVFYFKTTDANNSFSLKRYRFFEEDDEDVADSKYATKDDLSSLEDKISKLTETIEKQNRPKQKR